ncbi:hypothetical protein [Mannheimia indoligenes]|uniref:Uncharacterized protein n=1 Tax=Mannheimia indoligenes TaxID=3103145 RepID=A0ABU7ZGC9_9PAST
MRNKKLFSILVLSAAVYAESSDSHKEQQCSEEHNKIIAQYLDVSTEELSHRTLDFACKLDPNNKTETLVSYAVVEAKYTKENYGNDQNNTPKWEFLVARLNNQEILQSWKAEQEIDAAVDVSVGSLKIDTARYILNKNVRAFGVRFNNATRGPSAPEYSSNDNLMLFIAENNALKLIFDYPMQTWHIVDSEEAKTESAEIVLEMDTKNQTNGFNDIILKADITQRVWSKGVYMVDSELKSETNHQEKLRLKYKDNYYRPEKKVDWLY